MSDVALTDTAGNVVVSYTYDAWGVNTGITDANENAITDSSHIGNLNPFRYKSYCYDTETGLYYLNSRYYDPAVCRFISGDDVEYLGIDGAPISYNLFSYCKNNPVVGFDPNGHFSLVGAIIITGAIVGGLLGAFSAATTGGNILESAIEGCLTGALGATFGIRALTSIQAVGWAIVGGLVVDFATQVTAQYTKFRSVDLSKIDYGRVIKTGIQTGLGTAIPAFGEGAGNVIDAFGTALIWAESSALIVCADVVVTNSIAAVQPASGGVSMARHGSTCVLLR